MSKFTSELSIRPKVSNHKRVATIGIGCVVFALLLLGAYKFGLHNGSADYTSNKEIIERLSASNDILSKQLQSVKDETVLLRRQDQIQDEAYQQMSQAYASTEKENRYLESRLDFYRSIISPKSGQEGPMIQAFDQTWADDALKFDITIVQAIKHKHQVRASIRALLYDGADKTGQPLQQWPQTSAKGVNFQYFQQVWGEFGKTPLSDKAKIKVELTLADGTVQERWFDVLPQT